MPSAYRRTLMKLIIAYIRPEMLQNVKQELYLHEIYALSVTNILGAGRQKGYTEPYRGVTTQVNLLKKLRLELCVSDDKAAVAVQAIMDGGRTGHEGDGAVLVQDVVSATRIRTGQPL